MLILLILIAVVLIIIQATRPINLGLSQFEVDRRDKSGKLTKRDALRAKHQLAIAAILQIDSAVLLIIFVAIALSLFDLVAGIVSSVIFVFASQLLSGLELVKSSASKFYQFYEKQLLEFCEKFSRLSKYLTSLNLHTSASWPIKVYSKDELLELLKNSPNVLTKSESKLIKSTLTFDAKLVSEIMTPRSMIDSINHDELLGPVLLTELHQTGHSRFPVINDDIDHIVGMLYVRDLLAIDGNKNSSKVSQVMDSTVGFIRQDQTLDQALAAFLKTKKLLFVVINEFRETVGLLSLEDVIEALLGQKINDEFEKHTELRAVAQRNPRKNNLSDKSYNV